jgi:hypothetical protein
MEYSFPFWHVQRRQWLPLRRLRFTAAIALCFFAQTIPVTVRQPEVPTVNAGVGSCSATFTVNDANRKPIYNAKIDVTFRYGLFNAHKVSLEAFTNVNGEARFEGIPNVVKRPLEFQVQFGDRQKTVVDDPATNCAANFTVVLP